MKWLSATNKCWFDAGQFPFQQHFVVKRKHWYKYRIYFGSLFCSCFRGYFGSVLFLWNSFSNGKNINLGIMRSEELRNLFMQTRFIALNQLFLRIGCLCSHYAWTQIDWILRSIFGDCSVVVRLSRDQTVTIVIMYIFILAVFGVVALFFKMFGLKSFKQNFLLPPKAEK